MSDRNKKVKVYIDASNVLISMKQKNLSLEIDNFFVYLKDKFRSENIFYFTPNWKKENTTFEKISNIKNVEIIYKEIYNQNSKLKTNCDVDIAFKLTKDILNNEVEEIVLISGDGDFIPILDFAINRKINVRIIGGTKESTAKIIKKRNEFRYFLLTDVKELIKQKAPARNLI
jgi:hypothetical protein